MSEKSKFALLLFALLAWSAFIFLMSAESGIQSQSLSDGFISRMLAAIWPGYAEMPLPDQLILCESLSIPVRKTAHFLEYLVLGGLSLAVWRQWRIFRFALPPRQALPTLLYLIPPFMFSAVYACFDEFHQMFVDGRAARVMDVGIDSLGALVAIAALAALFRYVRK